MGICRGQASGLGFDRGHIIRDFSRDLLQSDAGGQEVEQVRPVRSDVGWAVRLVVASR
jgi:hypothetical protein